MNGTIIRIVRDRGFGFIRDEQGISRFFLYRDIAYDFDLVREGMNVHFDPVQGPEGKGNGQRAERISVIDAAQTTPTGTTTDGVRSGDDGSC